VYAAGISRSSRAEGDREAAVAEEIVGQAGELEVVLEALEECPLTLVQPGDDGADHRVAREDNERPQAAHR
jgi:hypothetical protein